MICRIAASEHCEHKLKSFKTDGVSSFSWSIKDVLMEEKKYSLILHSDTGPWFDGWIVINGLRYKKCR